MKSKNYSSVMYFQCIIVIFIVSWKSSIRILNLSTDVYLSTFAHIICIYTYVNTRFKNYLRIK